MGWMVNATPRSLYPEIDSVPNVQKAGWAPWPAWTGAGNLPPPGFHPQIVKPIASRYTDCAIPAHVRA
jgi:hypothetical protein